MSNSFSPESNSSKNNTLSIIIMIALAIIFVLRTNYLENKVKEEKEKFEQENLFYTEAVREIEKMYDMYEHTKDSLEYYKSIYEYDNFQIINEIVKEQTVMVKKQPKKQSNKPKLVKYTESYTNTQQPIYTIKHNGVIYYNDSSIIITN